MLFYTLKNFFNEKQILKEENKEKIDFKNTDNYTKKNQKPNTIGDLRNYIMTRGNLQAERSAQEMCLISAAMDEGVSQVDMLVQMRQEVTHILEMYVIYSIYLL